MTIQRTTLSLLTGFALSAVVFVGAGQSLASAQTPDATGQLAIQVTVLAGPAAAARTWRFEVVNSAGAAVQTLSVGTSGEAPTAAETTSPLPYGSYTIRQILGSDTRTICDATSFYEVASPAGAKTTVELGSARVTVPFTIRPCAALPTKLQVQVPIDTVAPTGGPALPPTPIDEVRGTRTGGPTGPLSPNTGDSPLTPPESNHAPSLLLVVLGLGATLIPSAGFAVAHARQRSRR